VVHSSGTLLSGNGGQSNDLVNLAATTPTITWDTGGRVSLNQLGSSYSWILGDILNLLDWNNVGNANPITGSFGSARQTSTCQPWAAAGLGHLAVHGAPVPSP